MEKRNKRWLSIIGRTILVVAIIIAILHLLDSFAVKTKGNKAENATITTMSGKKVSAKQKLDKYLSYNVGYHWEAKRLRAIKKGTVVKFYLPDNVRLNTGSLSFGVKDQHKHEIGTFSIRKDQSYGELTFNNYCQKHHEIKAEGYLFFTVNGTTEQKQKNWMINQVTWINGNNLPTWQIILNPKAEKLSQVYVSNVRIGNQKYDADSIELSFGHLNKKGEFVADKTIDNPIQQKLIKIQGDQQNTLVANLKKIHDVIQITYQTRPTTAGSLNLSNTAVVSYVGPDKKAHKQEVTASLQMDGRSTNK